MLLLSVILTMHIAATPLPRRASEDSAALEHRVYDAELAFIKAWRHEWKLSELPKTDRLYALVTGRVLVNTSSWTTGVPLWFSQYGTIAGDESVDIDNGLAPAAVRAMRLQRATLLRLMDSAAAILPGDRWLDGQRIRMYVDQGQPSPAWLAATQCAAEAWWCLELRGYVSHWARNDAMAELTFDSAYAIMPDSVRCSWNDLSLLFGVPSSVPVALLSRDLRTYHQLSCAQRDSADAVIWWLADPLYLEPGNMRRTEQRARVVLLELHRGLEIDERSDMDGDIQGLEYDQGTTFGRGLIQWGWPTSIGWRAQTPKDGMVIYTPTWCDPFPPPTKPAVSAAKTPPNPHPAHYTPNPVRTCVYIQRGGVWPFPQPQWAGPQNHTIPDWTAIDDPLHSTAADWDIAPTRIKQKYFDDSWWPTELYNRRAGVLVGLFDQIAFLRRESTAMIAAAAEWDTGGLVRTPPAHPTLGVITSAGPTDSLHITTLTFAAQEGSSARGGNTSRVIQLGGLLASVASRPLLLGIELVPSDFEGPAGRTRFGITPPAPLSALGSQELALSDPILIRPDSTGTAPAAIAAALPGMYGSTALLNPTRLAIFWEAYGLSANDTTTISLGITRTTQSTLAKLGSFLHLGASDSHLSVELTEPVQVGPIEPSDGVSIRPHGVVVDISQLVPGAYRLDLATTQRAATARSSRTFTIVRH